MPNRWVKWDDVSARAGHNDLPAILVNNHLKLPKAELAKGIHDAWTSAEWPEKYLAVEPGEMPINYPEGVGGWFLWTRMFERLGEDVYLHNDKIRPISELPEDGFEIYRGAIEDLQTGMSWTRSEERARWFARRFSGVDLARDGHPQNGHLYRMTVYPGGIIAMFDTRGEDEVVVNWENADAMSIDDLGEVPRKE